MIDIDKMIQTALKNGLKDHVRAYRNIKSRMMLAKTAKNAKYDEAAEISIINKYVKELEIDSATYFAIDRDDLGQEYAEEANILKVLLPQPPKDEDIVNAVWEFMRTNIGLDTPAIPQKQMGICIKYVKEKLPGVDGKKVSNIVKGFIKN